MQKLNKRVFATVALTIIFMILMSPLSLANSAEPPSIIIVVPNAPADMDITILTENGERVGYMEKKFMETQFSFYDFNYDPGMEYSIKVTHGDINETLSIGSTVNTYLNVYELDYKNLIVTKGTAGYRAWIYTAVRILLTLAIEAVVFFLFWYRDRRSWIIFILINLVTQGALNIWLHNASNFSSYLIILLIVAEAFVILIEVIGFLIFIKEHKKMRTFFYVLIANNVSLVLGGFLITRIPM